MPADLHATLASLLGAPVPPLSRGRSLLEPLPASRSCAEAGVAPHWCACLDWAQLPTSHSMPTQVINHCCC